MSLRSIIVEVNRHRIEEGPSVHWKSACLLQSESHTWAVHCHLLSRKSDAYPHIPYLCNLTYCFKMTFHDWKFVNAPECILSSCFITPHRKFPCENVSSSRRLPFFPIGMWNLYLRSPSVSAAVILIIALFWLHISNFSVSLSSRHIFLRFSLTKHHLWHHILSFFIPSNTPLNLSIKLANILYMLPIFAELEMHCYEKFNYFVFIRNSIRKT